jgi:sulfur carrier protein ThiS
MNVTVKLFATLTARLPPEARRPGQVRLEVPSGTSVRDLIDRLGLPRELCSLVLVDGRFVGTDQQGDRVLAEGEVLAIWPPVGGG